MACGPGIVEWHKAMRLVSVTLRLASSMLPQEILEPLRLVLRLFLGHHFTVDLESPTVLLVVGTCVTHCAVGSRYVSHPLCCW